MSNTSSLSPYDATSGSEDSMGIGSCVAVAAACAAGVVIGAVAVAAWLCEETPEDRQAVERFREARRKERIQDFASTRDLSADSSSSKSITTMQLHLRHTESFIESAQRLGYRVEPLPQPSMPLSEQPQLFLSKDSGERLAIHRNPKGCLAVSSAGGARRIEDLVRQHTLDRTVSYLKNAGMQVKTAGLVNGEVQILAREASARRGGAAEVKAQVRADGRVWMDVDKIQGNRCEEIVSQLAEAIGAEVSGTQKKDAFYQLPGEPAKTRGRVSS